MSIERGEIIAIAIIILWGFALRQVAFAAEIDLQKDVYLFLHDREMTCGKSGKRPGYLWIFKGENNPGYPAKSGNVGDYMAMLWKPPEPDHIKIQRDNKG